MFKSISSSLLSSNIQSLSTRYLPEITNQHLKILRVALGILSIVGMVCFFYRRYKIKELNQNQTIIPPYISPNPIIHHNPKILDPKILDPKILDPKILDPKIIDPKTFVDNDDQDKNPTETDEEIAKRLLEEELADCDKDPLEEDPTESPIEKPKEVTSSPIKLKETNDPFEEIDEICGIIESDIFKPGFSAVRAFDAVKDKKKKDPLILDCFNIIVKEFEKRYSISQKIRYKDLVPAYFANVKDQTDEQRKYLSLVGIRNMLYCGPSIVDDLKEKLFLGGESNYDVGKGLNAFKYYTGNLVDLDVEFEAKSDAEALKQTEELIIKFGKMHGLKNPGKKPLTALDVEQAFPWRKLDLPQLPYGVIHVSNHNQDRSNHGIWKRVDPNTFKTNYYANVPNLSLVLMATLKLPYLAAELIYRLKEKNQGVIPQDFFDDFFENGLSDRCFNDKAHTLRNFHLKWMAKLDGALTPEEEAIKRVKEGSFGPALQQKGPDIALKEAYSRAKLFNLLGTHHICSEVNGRSMEQWVQEEEAKVIPFLKQQKLWENVLYQTDAGQDFFLLNKSTLGLFMKEYFNVALYM